MNEIIISGKRDYTLFKLIKFCCNVVLKDKNRVLGYLYVKNYDEYVHVIGCDAVQLHTAYLYRDCFENLNDFIDGLYNVKKNSKDEIIIVKTDLELDKYPECEKVIIEPIRKRVEFKDLGYCYFVDGDKEKDEFVAKVIYEFMSVYRDKGVISYRYLENAFIDLAHVKVGFDENFLILDYFMACSHPSEKLIATAVFITFKK